MKSDAAVVMDDLAHKPFSTLLVPSFIQRLLKDLAISP
jgi:hypothetical protein